MPILSGVHIRTQDPEKLAEFYASALGMRIIKDSQSLRVGYSTRDADIVLLPGGESYRHDKRDRYWKVGITLPNIDIAYSQLCKAGLPVSPPQQFHDIGYMCHLTDPEGHQIELLQHDFEGNRPASAGDPDQPLGGGARVGQITLRAADIGSDLSLFQSLGMRLLSVQPVPSHGFDLYFLGFTGEMPPAESLTSVANREWLWKRPYTTLEFQHLAGAEINKNSGYAGIEISGLKGAVSDDFGDPIHGR